MVQIIEPWPFYIVINYHKLLGVILHQLNNTWQDTRTAVIVLLSTLQFVTASGFPDEKNIPNQNVSSKQILKTKNNWTVTEKSKK